MEPTARDPSFPQTNPIHSLVFTFGSLSLKLDEATSTTESTVDTFTQYYPTSYSHLISPSTSKETTMPQCHNHSAEPTDNKEQPYQFHGATMKQTNSTPSHTSITSSIITPMPVSGSSKAPKFVGIRPTYFLKQIKTLGRLAGLDNDDELVNWIIWYSSKEECCCFQYLPEFDPDVMGRSWYEAAKLLKYLYCSTEKLPMVRRHDLETFCKASSKAPKFSKKLQVDQYGSKFMAIVGPLMKERTLTKKEVEHLFVVGLPNKDLRYLMKVLPEAKRVRTNPPSYYEVHQQKGTWT